MSTIKQRTYNALSKIINHNFCDDDLPRKIADFGDSLDAVECEMSIEEEFADEIPDSSDSRYYETPDITIADLLAHVEKSIAARRWLPVVPATKADK